MKFYTREKEVAYLRDVREKSHVHARFTVITGRRRVGKTQLVQQAMGDAPISISMSAGRARRTCARAFSL